MKHHFAKIRIEAAVLYARQHPETTLRDIGLALGFTEYAAKSMISAACREAGIIRPRGAGSPSYDKSVIVGTAHKEYDRAAVVRMLKEGELSYSEIGEKVGLHFSSIYQIAKAEGLTVGFHSEEHHRRMSEGKKLKTDEELREYFSVPRPGPLRVHAAVLGYAPKGLRKALYRIGIKPIKAATNGL